MINLTENLSENLGNTDLWFFCEKDGISSVVQMFSR